MFALLLLSALTTNTAGASGCELTDQARKDYRQISLEGCGFDFCVRYTTASGRQGLERLKPSGCGASNCFSVSPSFTHVYSTESSVDTQYLGDRSGQKVYLICNFPR